MHRWIYQISETCHCTSVSHNNKIAVATKWDFEAMGALFLGHKILSLIFIILSFLLRVEVKFNEIQVWSVYKEV